MIKWTLFMPFVWLMDYLYGIINPSFRKLYLLVQENLTNYMQQEQEKLKEVKNV